MQHFISLQLRQIAVSNAIVSVCKSLKYHKGNEQIRSNANKQQSYRSLPTVYLRRVFAISCRCI